MLILLYGCYGYNNNYFISIVVIVTAVLSDDAVSIRDPWGLNATFDISPVVFVFIVVVAVIVVVVFLKIFPSFCFCYFIIIILTFVPCKD